MIDQPSTLTSLEKVIIFIYLTVKSNEIWDWL